MSNTRQELRLQSFLIFLTIGLVFLIDRIWPLFFYGDDNCIQYMPAFTEIARAWKAGEIPLLSRCVWEGCGLAGEYQYGIFSVVQQALVVLLSWVQDLPLRLLCFCSFYLSLTCLGGYRLARSYGLESQFASAAGLAMTFNGYLICLGAASWFPSMAAFAWLPWLWWSLEERRSWKVSALLTYLLVSACSPFMDLIAALLLASYLVSSAFQRDGRFRGLLLASLVGGALASPALLMLVEYFQQSSRPVALTTHRAAYLWDYLGSLLPLFSCGLMSPRANPNSTLFTNCGLFPAIGLVFAVVGWGALWSQRRLLFLAMVSLIASMAPSAGGFQWSFRWLGIFNPVAILLGTLVLQQNSEKTRLIWRNPGWIGFLVLTFTHQIPPEWLGYFEPKIRFSPEEYPLIRFWGFGFSATVALFWGLWWQFWPRWRGFSCVAVAIATMLMPIALRQDMIFTRFEYSPAVNRAAPLDPGRRYLSAYYTPHGLTSVGEQLCARPGNLPMLAGLDFLNGYSPLFLPLKHVYEPGFNGQVNSENSFPLLRDELGPGGILQVFGVDGILLSVYLPWDEALLKNGWKQMGTTPDVTLWHRQGAASPRVQAVKRATRVGSVAQAGRLLRKRAEGEAAAVFCADLRSHPDSQPEVCNYASAEISEVRQGRNDVSAHINPDGSEPTALIVCARPWLPGWKATYEGQPVSVWCYDKGCLAVEIPAQQSGRLVLRYWPTSLTVGLVLAGLGLAALLKIR